MGCCGYSDAGWMRWPTQWRPALAVALFFQNVSCEHHHHADRIKAHDDYGPHQKARVDLF
jgi:hypothetical protein